MADHLLLRRQEPSREGHLLGRARRRALEQIAQLGGGTVESYPEDVGGRNVSASFLYNSRLSMFERQGFERIRRIGKNHWVVGKVVHAGQRVT